MRASGGVYCLPVTQDTASTYLQLETVAVVVADPCVAGEDVGSLVLLVPHHCAAAVQEALADLSQETGRGVSDDTTTGRGVNDGTTTERRDTATEDKGY